MSCSCNRCKLCHSPAVFRAILQLRKGWSFGCAAASSLTMLRITLRLIPTATYFPLRFQLMRSLLRISRSSGTYIPLAPALLEVLSSAEMKKPPKPSTLKPLDFSTTIRAPKAYARTRTYQDGIGEQVAELLSEFFALWTKSIAFPELCLPVTVALRRWLKDTSPASSSRHRGSKSKGNRNGKLAAALQLLAAKLSANAAFISTRRATVEFAPQDRDGVEGFLRDVDWTATPLGAFVVGQRKQREERAKLVEAGRRGEAEKHRSRRNGAVSDEDTDEDGEGGDADSEDASDSEA